MYMTRFHTAVECLKDAYVMKHESYAQNGRHYATSDHYCFRNRNSRRFILFKQFIQFKNFETAKDTIFYFKDYFRL